MKRVLIISVLVLFAFTLAWSAGQEEAATAAAAETNVLRCGLNISDQTPIAAAWKNFGEILNERSNGRYQVDFFFNAQLGDKQTHMTMLQTGSLDMWMIMGGFLSDYGAKQLEVLMLPYLFDNVEHARAVHQSPIGEEMLNSIQASGTRVVGIGMFQDAPRDFFFSDRPVTSLTDMDGLKIRAQPGSIYEALLESFGGSVVPIAFSELYSALQTGVVDGAEQPISGYSSKKFYEVAPYYLRDGHEISPNYAIFSELSWNNLSAEDQILIKECMNEAIKGFNETSAQLDREIFEMLESEGVTFLEPDNPEEWKAAASALYAEYTPGYGDLIEKIKNTEY